MFTGHFEEEALVDNTDEKFYVMHDPKMGILVYTRGSDELTYSSVPTTQPSDAAPTYTASECETNANLFANRFAGLHLEGIEVVPDLPFRRASMLACMRGWLKAKGVAPFPNWSTMPTAVRPRVRA